MNKLDEMLLGAIRKDFLEAIDMAIRESVYGKTQQWDGWPGSINIAKNVFAAIEAYME
jgi:hypothetical protein